MTSRPFCIFYFTNRTFLVQFFSDPTFGTFGFAQPHKPTLRKTKRAKFPTAPLGQHEFLTTFAPQNASVQTTYNFSTVLVVYGGSHLKL
jgi:hypothetical protein